MLMRFFKDCRGSVAPILALTALPLLGSVGVAVDFSRANAARTAFQNALDFDRVDDLAERRDLVRRRSPGLGDHHFQRVVYPPGYQEYFHPSQLFHRRRVKDHAQWQRHHRHEFPWRFRIQPTRHHREIRVRAGATQGCASLWCWTIPARCPVPTR